jgi:hypothetical protein
MTGTVINNGAISYSIWTSPLLIYDRYGHIVMSVAVILMEPLLPWGSLIGSCNGIEQITAPHKAADLFHGCLCIWSVNGLSGNLDSDIEFGIDGVVAVCS